jgi:hypothetical protein
MGRSRRCLCLWHRPCAATAVWEPGCLLPSSSCIPPTLTVTLVALSGLGSDVLSLAQYMREMWQSNASCDGMPCA